MAWVRMIETDRHTIRRATTRYDGGKSYPVKRAVCVALVERGTAVEISAPRRRPPRVTGE